MCASLPAFFLPVLARVGLIAWGAFWGTLPDAIEWKTTGAHWRSLATHSPFSLLFPGAIGLGIILGLGDIFLCVGAVLAWGSHLLLDSLNSTGIPTRLGVYRHLACIPYNSLRVNSVLCLACGVSLLFVLGA